MTDQKFRLVTRSDFDGLVCAVLLKELDLIDEIQFVHPKDMQDGLVPITERDITTNVPYVDGCYIAFDHHLSEATRISPVDNHIIDPEAPSAARVVYNYYGGKAQFPNISDDLMRAVDQADSAQYDSQDVLNPSGWTLLNFIMDPRTGLGRFRDFRTSNRQLMMDLIEYCAKHPIEDILALPDVKERTDLYFAQAEKFIEQMKRVAKLDGKVIVIDLLNEDVIHAGNRFMIYALYPQGEVSIHKMWGPQKQKIVLACGRSIFNRASKVEIGGLMLKHGGGGHAAAGTCQIEIAEADTVIAELIKEFNA